MKKSAVQTDEDHEFTGVTIRIISVSNIKTEIDGGQVYVRIRCNDKSVSTKKRPNDRANVVFGEDFFYNTTEILDDDIMFELWSIQHGQGASKNLSASKVSNSRSKMNEYEGQAIGGTKSIQVSRLSRQKQEKTYELTSSENKTVGKITVSYDYMERQDIIGGIKCPNLSLRPDHVTRSALTLENKYASYKNLYSFLDGNTTPNCEFFPRKFHH